MENERIIVAQIKSKFLHSNTLPKREDLLNDLAGIKDMPGEIFHIFWNIEKTLIDWEKCEQIMLEEIEVFHQIGMGITDNNLKYDRAWFTNFLKTNKSNYYTDRFFTKYSVGLSPIVLYTLKQDQEQIVNLCGSPTRDEEKDIRGLVFGFVQSGKTLNYTSVANAAMDSGYNMIVILAGATNILRKQTQERVNMDVIGWNGSENVGVGKVDNNMAKRPTSLTTVDLDFDKKIARQNMGGYTLRTVTVPVVAVIKKNVNALRNINAWLSSQNITGQINKSILLIDDESDYASVNTREAEDPTAINKGIREMLNHFEVSTYLAITATPFANVLINVDNLNDEFGTDLFPRSFIWTLDKPSTYLGVNEIVNDRFSNIYHAAGSNREHENERIINDIFKAKKDYKINELPLFIETALAHFIFQSARLRHNLGYTSDLSMMVNISRFTNHHQDIAGFLDARTSFIRKEIRSRLIQNAKDPILVTIHKLYSDYNIKISLSDFNKLVEDQILQLEIIDIHSLSKKVVSFTGLGSINHVVVGGLSLSRGFTIEGLITSVFLRNTQTYDALMQMGRWFGHKQFLQEYIELFTTPTIQRRFQVIEDATLDLIDQLKSMRDRGETPREFGLSIKLDPQVAMQVVAYNKSRDANKIMVSLSIEGKSCETTKIWQDPLIRDENSIAVIQLLDSVTSDGTKVSKSSGLYIPGGRDHFAYQNVPVEHLVKFIENFDIPHKSVSQISSKMPYFFLLEHLKQNTLNFDFILMEGDGDDLKFSNRYDSVKKSIRTFNITEESYIQISKNQLSRGGEDESAFLAVKKSKREDARLDRKATFGNTPLLVLYAVQGKTFENIVLGDYWCWGISIPGDSTKKEVKFVLSNSVLLKALVEDAEDYFDDLNDEEI